jgi:hypothetical protein
MREGKQPVHLSLHGCFGYSSLVLICLNNEVVEVLDYGFDLTLSMLAFALDSVCLSASHHQFERELSATLLVATLSKT